MSVRLLTNTWEQANAGLQASHRRASFNVVVNPRGNHRAPTLTVTEACKKIGIANSTAYEPQWKHLFDQAKKKGWIVG